jgi:hypothetical protein
MTLETNYNEVFGFFFSGSRKPGQSRQYKCKNFKK